MSHHSSVLFALPWVLIAASLCGCVGDRVRCAYYSWGTICKGGQNAINKICSPIDGYWDDGTARPRFADVNGCASENTKTIWLKDSCSGAEALPHELAHLDGFKNPEASGYDWSDFGSD